MNNEPLVARSTPPAGGSPTQHRRLEPMEVGWLMERAPDAAILTDPAGTIEYVNPAFEVLTGYRRDEVIGRTPSIVKSGRQTREFYRGLWSTISRGEEFCGVLVNRRKSGELYHEEKAIRPLFDSQGRITHFLSSGRDISDRIATMERLTHAATHDALTELPNRALFFDRLEQALSRARRGGERFAVALLDIDRFKAVNDSLGQAAGDARLRAVAQRLQRCVREVDTVARLGGDEFVLLLAGAEDEARTARALHTILRALATPVDLEEGRVRVSASVGACLGGLDIADARGLLRRADEAMYRAKRSGGNGFHLHGVDAAAAGARERTPPGPSGAAERLDFRGEQESLLLREGVPIAHKIVHRGDYIYRAGQHLGFVYVVHAGSVRIDSCTPDGREHVVALRFKGDWLGLDGIAKRVHPFDAVALETGEVWAIQCDALLRACSSSPALLAALCGSMSREILRDCDLRVTIESLPVDGRVAEFLRQRVDAL
jgi:diguanylate cyclase (GGDEF)-like protein/PAS domain S-box-containing protein